MGWGERKGAAVESDAPHSTRCSHSQKGAAADEDGCCGTDTSLTNADETVAPPRPVARSPSAAENATLPLLLLLLALLVTAA